jgi:hypothetical protein
VISHLYVDGPAPRASPYGLKFFQRVLRFLDAIRLVADRGLNCPSGGGAVSPIGCA